MTGTLNPKYSPPSRDLLSNTLIPAWYSIEKDKVKEELRAADHVAVTADGWSSVAQDHYLTVTVHYIMEAELREKVLHTRAVYISQTGPAVAEEIDGILEEFGVKAKVVAVTVDNAANMDVAMKKMQVLKMGCFAHTLNVAAQKLYRLQTVANWSGRIRAIVVWLRKASLAKPVLKEKQRLLGMLTVYYNQCYCFFFIPPQNTTTIWGQTQKCLCNMFLFDFLKGLPEHAILLDVRTRWNSLFLMVERFLEQYPAIQAASMDLRLKKSMDRDRYTY